ncbi:hypothetical protein DICPUDRAFT_54199 [Dictyostelium purpureum]|uniref:Enoyl reductase (ER) domain-containing protein n=1 Tax=Dictyostelium purpureum TaxID=5786 RepID=F0ZG02_DICPU|nr:uncharacterized protein DICPUDRAFT_54199 [Dictyostelium purpureum]EGC37130.1 hypothetical protein DICPUDRAFT_54199 [Dictyostelium purpureum]|eukprot:XP_003286333.1 hypothetical protein DICPUDRAFT_54199 [Dictyostelium purpureum]
MVKQILLKEYVSYGAPTTNNFTFSDFELDESKLEENQILVSLVLVSVDPYLRGRMSLAKSYAESYKLNEPMISFSVAKVLKSNNAKFAVGDYVVDGFPWQEKSIVTPSPFANKVDPKIPLETYLSALGLTGLTAYHGLNEIGKPKEGETLVVSAGSGATGSIVGQIGKIKGSRVVGIAGSDEKVKFMVEELGFDAGVNYKSPNYKEELAAACPKGVDVYFENVGGDVSEAVWPLLNFKSRTVVCGVISQYNRTTPDIGPRTIELYILKTSSLMQGFIVSNYFSNNPAAIKDLSQWFAEGKLKDKHTINSGFDQIVPSFLSLFEGTNTGKMIVRVSNN